LKLLATAAVFAGAVAFWASPVWAVHDAGLYEMDNGVNGANTEDSSAVPPPKNGDAVGEDDADTIFHEECNAGTVVVPANNPTSNYADGQECGSGTAGSGFRDNDPAEDSMSGAFEQKFIDDEFEPDVTHHEPSNKDEAPIGGSAGSQLSAVSSNPWGCVTKPNVNNKNDLKQGFVAFYEGTGVGDLDAGDLVVYTGGLRDKNEGNENLGVWFLRDKDVECDSTGTGVFEGVHRDGDVLLVGEFTNGGTAADIFAFRWNDPTPLAPESGDETLDLIPGAADGFCNDQNDAGNSHTNPAGIAQTLCGEVNNVDIEPAWEPEIFGCGPQANKPDCGTVQPNQWAEMVANLTDLLPGDDECFAKVLIETRTSQSVTANLFDYMIAEVNICGTLTIEKETIGGFGAFDFSSTSGNSQLPADCAATGVPDASGDFTLTTTAAGEGGVDSITCVDIFEDLYDTDETVPTNWQLVDIVISGDSDAGTTDPLDTTDTPIAAGNTFGLDIDLDRGEAITVRFINEALADITLIKDIVNACAVDGGTFTLRIDGAPPAGCIGVGDGTCVTNLSIPAGAYTIDEIGASANLADYVSDVDCGSFGSDSDTDVDITLAAGDSATCTFENHRKPTLTLVKDTPSALQVDLLVNSVAVDSGASLTNVTYDSGDGTDVGDGGTVTVRVDAPFSDSTNLFGPVNIAEMAPGGGAIGSSFHSFVSCDDANGPTSSAATSDTIPSLLTGEAVTCTFTNTPIALGLCSP
jgi:hypothetical protein